METIIDSKQYPELVNSVYQLILAEIKAVKDIESQYPKLIIMAEFFSLLRGDVFLEFRGHTPEFQQDFYRMEDEIFNKIKELKKEIPLDSEKAKFNYENMISIGLRL